MPCWQQAEQCSIPPAVTQEHRESPESQTVWPKNLKKTNKEKDKSTYTGKAGNVKHM